MPKQSGRKAGRRTADVAVDPPNPLQFGPRREAPALAVPARPADPRLRPSTAVDLARQVDRLMLARYAPPGVLVTESLDVVQFRGQTGAFLQPAPGEPQSSLIKMARAGLLTPLRAAIAQAKKDLAPVRRPAEIEQERLDDDRHEGVRPTRRCELVVVPFTGPPEAAHRRLFLVLFEDATPAAKNASVPQGAGKGASQGKPPRADSARDRARVPRLEHELLATKEYLQSLIEEHGQTIADLGAANEELISGNEELQSLNEELETAQEELQATNEELTNVNDQLHARNQEVNLVNSDLINLLSTVDVPLLILDQKRRIRRFTPRARSILNVVPGDVGRPFDDIRSNLSVEGLDAQIADVIEGVALKEAEVQDRQGRWYRLQIRPYRTGDGRIDGAILSLVDIDVFKRHLAQADEATAQAERANRAKDEFLAMLSHELRTPLTTILLQAQRIRRGSIDLEKLERVGESIERGTLMQVQLIDHLLDVSRIVTGKLEMSLAPVDFVDVVKTALEGVAGPVASKPLTLTVSLDPLVDKIWGNATRLQQVVSNLLTNAVKFTPPGGEIKVSLDRANGHALLQVSDTGRGIAPGFLGQVFRRFSQEDNSVTRSYGGLGLGLAIAQHLVDLHGGTIRAESAGLGRGASFFVSLPLQGTARSIFSEASSGPRLSLVTSPPEGALGRFADLRVLIVDDDPGARAAVAEIFEETGAEVRVAGSAADGLKFVEEFRPGVVVCDIAMPEEDGYSFIRRMRALGIGRGGATPVLALSAMAGEEDRRRALQAGFQMHVAKPVDGRRLSQAVFDLSHAPLCPVTGPLMSP